MFALELYFKVFSVPQIYRFHLEEGKIAPTEIDIKSCQRADLDLLVTDVKHYYL